MENERKMCLCTGMLFDGTDAPLVQIQVPDFTADTQASQPVSPDSAS
jgi:hypothetical protein